MQINVNTKFEIGQKVYHVTHNLKKYIVIPVTIEEIQVSQKSESCSIWYIDGIMKYLETQLIKTLEEAENKCTELNKEVTTNED